MTSSFEYLIGLLRSEGVQFERGLSDAEISSVEKTFAFRFPTDLREFLQLALPVGSGFPNWRSDAKDVLLHKLAWPLEGILFDVERNEFWLPEWGDRPESLVEAIHLASARIEIAPKLVPIYGHRYMPTEPRTPGNPVFSVYQTDIIWYGFDLKDYFRHEFKLELREKWPATVTVIDFWDPIRFGDLR
jgi:hypothetical protein